jgi:hypothetical protein
MTCQLDQEFVVYKANSKVATVTLPLLQDHLLSRGRAPCCHQFTFCSRSPHRNVINLSLSGVSRGVVTACGGWVGRLRVNGWQNPVRTETSEPESGSQSSTNFHWASAAAGTEVGDYLRDEQRASLVHSRSPRRRTVSYDVPPARFKRKFRSGSFSVIVAARANSSLAWSRRPSLSSKSPRTLGSR